MKKQLLSLFTLMLIASFSIGQTSQFLLGGLTFGGDSLLDANIGNGEVGPEGLDLGVSEVVSFTAASAGTLDAIKILTNPGNSVDRSGWGGTWGNVVVGEAFIGTYEITKVEIVGKYDHDFSSDDTLNYLNLFDAEGAYTLNTIQHAGSFASDVSANDKVSVTSAGHWEWDAYLVVLQSATVVAPGDVINVTITVTALTSVEETNAVSQSLNVYPNPASGNATLAYTLDQESDVVVDIYNVTGQKVMTAFNGTQMAGAQSLPVNVKSLSTGLYYAAITANNVKMGLKKLIIK